MSGTLISFGHGYSAQALARILLRQGWTIHGTSRDPDTLPGMAATGAQGHLFPGEDFGPLLQEATHLLISAGPREKGDPVLNVLRDQITEVAPRLQWVGYLSTTGVYGDYDGDWVDENTPCNPTTQRGQWRLQAEQDWQSIPDLPLHIFRLAGIYGPGRGPFAKLRSGRARRIVKPGQVFSRIHVADIAQVLAASIAQPNPGAIYNMCDDDPAPPQDVIEYGARLLGIDPPPAQSIDEVEMTPMARSFYAENKRVSNRRIKEELGVQLIHPDYRSGLKALLAAESGPAG